MTEYEQDVLQQLSDLLTTQNTQIQTLQSIDQSLTEINNNLCEIKSYSAYTTVLILIGLIIFVAYAMIIYTTDLDHRL